MPTRPRLFSLFAIGLFLAQIAPSSAQTQVRIQTRDNADTPKHPAVPERDFVKPIMVAVNAPPPPAAPAPNQRPLRKGEVLLNFQAADIQAVIKAVSQMTGRNFLLDPRVKGQVTIISAKPVSSAAAYEIFISALKAQGFAAVQGPGGVVKIIPTGEAKQNAGVSVRAVPRGGEQMTTQVVVIQHGSPTQMIPLLRPLMAPTSQLSAYESANALIITDYADNIRRILQIIEKIDQPISTDVTIIPLQHASALDIAELVSRLTATGPVAPGQPGAAQAMQGGERFTVIPDLRTNSLLVRTDNPGRLAQLQSLIAKLDVPAKQVGNTRVVYLKNADAVKLADVLRGLLAGEARTRPAAAPTTAARAPAAAQQMEPSLIQADEATNSLIISASDAVYNNLRAVIEKLDVRRAQVFVEALIAEITADKATEFGFQWVGGRERGQGAIGGVQNFVGSRAPIIGTAVEPVGVLGQASGLTLAYLGKKVTLPDGTVVRSLGALARALEDKSLANILSTPNLMTLDNAEAKIVVGQNVPFVTGSFAQATTAAGAVNPFQTIERKDVGLTLKIKPQISEGGAIKMEIFQEVSNVVPAAGASDVRTNKRSLETKVVVDDGDTIVLGGLIQDEAQDTIQQVPVLGSIPLIGSLFRHRQHEKKKTNLMVFLRPIIIRTPEQGYGVTVDRYNYLRATQKAIGEETLKRFQPTRPEEPEQPLPTPDESELLGPPNVSDSTESSPVESP